MAGNKVIAEFYKTDSSETPEGYYPVPKSTIREAERNGYNSFKRPANICRQCDWRSACSASVCGCMSYNRKDGVSVVFKTQLIKEKNNDR